MILSSIDEKNPTDMMGGTPLHEAADNGHLEIVKLIMGHVKNKNPAMKYYGTTPLHYAAEKGHLEICRLIIQNVENKNPKSFRRVSVISLTYFFAHISTICQYMFLLLCLSLPKFALL